MLGNREEAITHLQVADRLGFTGAPATRLAYIYSIAGLMDDAQRLLERGSGPGINQVEYQLARGDEAAALAALRSAVEDGALALLPLFRVRDNVWQDPRLDKPEFRELREQLAFEE